MRTPDDIHDARAPGLDDFEPDLMPVAKRLHDSRPAPQPSFRGSLREEMAVDVRRSKPAASPPAIPILVPSCFASGLLLLAIAALGLAGSGPFAA